MPDTSLDLTGKLLIAMPGMGDARFDHSVIYLAAHSDEGAMGLIVNKPTPGVSLADVLDQLPVTATGEMPKLAVHFGGPVEVERGFVLHSAEYKSAMQTLEIDGGFALTATLDILEDIATGGGPEQALLTLGYAGWGPSQLERELAMNGWLTCDASRSLVFGLPDDEKWAAAVNSLGVDPTGLSAAAGRA
jgi:putative transcriptional regulator